MTIKFDLTEPNNAYFYGFAQADGHLSESTRNRGRLSIELNIRDKPLLEQFAKLLPVGSSLKERVRSTNFKKDSHTAILNIFDWEFRELLKGLGFGVGKKCHSVSPPKTTSKVDYIRGLIDADGSLGMTGTGIPFISLTTQSEAVKEYVLDFYFEVTGRRYSPNRNSRDNIYNLMATCEHAQKIIKTLYYDEAICLTRKKGTSVETLAWIRPANRALKPQSKRWTTSEDEIVKSLPKEQAAKSLNRTLSSIQNRRFRLGVL